MITPLDFLCWVVVFVCWAMAIFAMNPHRRPPRWPTIGRAAFVASIVTAGFHLVLRALGRD